MTVGMNDTLESQYNPDGSCSQFVVSQPSKSLDIKIKLSHKF